MINKKILGVMAFALVMIVGSCPAFAASSSTATQTVIVNVNPTVAITVTPLLNYTVDADGSSNAKTSTITSTSNVAIDVYTKALAFTPSGTDSLTLNDFTYGGTAFTTSYAKMITALAKAPKGSSTTSAQTLTVIAPLGTAPGTYNTTVTYTAVVNGATGPT